MQVVIQITDCHLNSGDKLLRGIDTSASLAAVTDEIAARHPDISLLLATGDIVDDGLPSTYAGFLSIINGLARDSVWIPGNHDEPEVMDQLDRANLLGRNFIELGRWLIVLLDSQVQGEVHGELSAGQLNFLAGKLEQSRAQHVLIVLHHQVEPVGTAWMDRLMLQNAGAFFSVIREYDNIRGIVFGHVHQALDYWRDKIRIMATPSTSVQFKPGSERFEVDQTLPGYRWFLLDDEGSFESGVTRITDESFLPDQ